MEQAHGAARTHDSARVQDRILEEILLQKGLQVLNDRSPTRSSTSMLDRKKAERFLPTFISSTKKNGKETTHRNAYRQQMSKAIQIKRKQETEKFRIEELSAAIDTMKVKRAAGTDYIQICFLRELFANTNDKLLRLYNRSYADCTTPDAWLQAEMIAIEKPGRTHEFLPISLTNVLGR